MKYLFILFASFPMTTTIKAQETILAETRNEYIPLEDILSYKGQTIELVGSYYGTRYSKEKKGAPTYIYIGAPYPKQALTLIILGKDRNKFNMKFIEEEVMMGYEMIIKGLVKIANGKPQITLTKEEQLQVKSIVIMNPLSGQ